MLLELLYDSQKINGITFFIRGTNIDWECNECKKIIPKKTKAWHHDMGIAKCDGILCSEECATIWSRDYVPSRY